MDGALMAARSFSTKEQQELSKGLNAAIEAEVAKNKVLEVENYPPQWENSYQYCPHPYTRS